MELRKNPAFDLERKRGMFFSIGLLLSVSMVLMAFEWTSKVEKIIVPDDQEDLDLVHFMEPVATVIRPPERSQPIVRKSVQAPIFVETKEEVEEVLKELIPDEPEEISLPFIDEPIEEEPDVWIGIVEEMPAPVHGMSSFYSHIGKSLRYPKTAQRMGIEGRVFVQFVVDRDGSLTDIQVIKGIGAGCDEEAMRVIANSPSWKPGKQRGKPVKVRMIVPIVFRLN
ncbi:energy transducer TonB [Reichenbachiella agarivorans]|uniref:Energy transducer TonB n=1 Tax=Reichenbachiella agarivorans TaxID=2979464 RepID=A0ABY6CS39_9BACT|nr:energy transducer TonB [Reichenbachiella agarivorans]UXP33154.1 energy transducer TonB [Reichenbachiella agarivorans]